MKAKEYYESIIAKNPQTADEMANAVGDVVIGLNREAAELFKKRNARRNDAVRAVIREQNNKWNAIVGLFEKKQGISPIRRNAYLDAWVKQIPELDPNYDNNRVVFDYSNPNVLPTLAMLGAMALGEI